MLQRPRQPFEVPSDVTYSAATNGEEGPACLSCRRRKLRCSREHPSCSQCMRLASECVYDHRRQKPGLKAGAIETINQRLEAIEQKLKNINNNGASGSASIVSPEEVRGCVYHASLLLANHLESESEVGNGAESSHASKFPTSRLLNCRGRDSLATEEHEPQRPNEDIQLSRKRRRISQRQHDRSVVRRLGGIENALPSKSVIDLVLVQYFATIHHWIPMLHEGRFRARLQDVMELAHLTTLLHAMTAITLRHIDHDETDLDLDAVDEQIQTSTDTVTLHALDNISVENCQALIMICWDRMGCGDWSRAWSVLGSLTRTVDYLQMTVEPDVSRAHPLLAPVTLLKASRSHAEAEERKRVFWHIFLLDRLCSMCCGWSTTFSSDNVSRQLPCNGGIWRRGEEATTPYFLMWEKSQAKMGHSVAYLPTYQASANSRSVQSSSPGAPQGVDISNLGAVAYRIEATESLSRVSSFFLQLHVNFEDKREISDWLTRFKELDLRLVHWKQFLPQRWRESRVHKDAIVKMDPNLTLAHVTHNASMILLHQHIGYPSATLKGAVNLPSSCSAETCELAAKETAGITSKYLRQAPDIMVNSDFAFCAFVAARVLLVHSQYYAIELAPEFSSLLDDLDEMSRRWRGLQTQCANAVDSEQGELDLAGRFTLQLIGYHSECINDGRQIVHVLRHSAADAILGSDQHIKRKSMVAAASQSERTPRTGQGVVVTKTTPRPTANVDLEVTPMHHSPEDRAQAQSPVLTTGAADPRGIQSYQPNQPLTFGFPTPTRAVHTSGTTPDGQDNLMAMSDSLMAQGFTNLDRVIMSDGADFSFSGFDFADFSFGPFDMSSNT